MKGGGACMADSFERWRELGQRLQLFQYFKLVGTQLIIINLIRDAPSVADGAGAVVTGLYN